MHKRNAFTLVELLVVVGIIAILATMAVPRIGRALDDAKEQQCRTNLRNLQAAVVAYSQDNGGRLPVALSYEVQDHLGRYHERPGWVRWVPVKSSGDNSRESFVNKAWSDKEQKKNPASHAADMADDTGCGDGAKWAIQLGTLFDYVGDIRSYRCPVIEREVKKRWSRSSSAGDFDAEDAAMDKADGKVAVWRTYAMNPFFGALSVGGGNNTWYQLDSGRVGTTHRYRDYVGNSGAKYHSKFHKNLESCPIPEASKLLLFTEIIPEYENPGTLETRKNSGDFARGAGNLSKSPCLDPEDPDTRNEYACWDTSTGVKDTEWEFGIHSSPEPGRHTALAVFYDGHIEKIDPRCGDDKYNTVWFLNRGYAPGSMPAE